MKSKSVVLWVLGLVVFVGTSFAHAQNVTITPLGTVAGEFCTSDRALLFEDPTGVRVLIAPGRTVNSSTDPRLPDPKGASGGVHVLLIDHPHTDHLGERLATNCAGTTFTTFASKSNVNAAEIAFAHKSVLPVGGELSTYFAQKLTDFGVPAAATSCPVAVSGLDNIITVPRTTNACVTSLRGGTVTVTFSGQTQGVKITTIPAYHAAGATNSEVDPPGVAPGLTGYAGSESGYIIRFTNGLTVLWTGDSGLIGDWATQSEFYKPNLAVVHMDGLFTMGPEAAAFAVNRLIKPVTVIPEHANQVSTSGGVVIPNTRVDFFTRAVHDAKVVVPLSGIPISCDGKGRCSGAGAGKAQDGDRGGK